MDPPYKQKEPAQSGSFCLKSDLRINIVKNADHDKDENDEEESFLPCHITPGIASLIPFSGEPSDISSKEHS